MLENEQNFRDSEAMEYWKQLGVEAQDNILSSAWCPDCFGHVDMGFHDVSLEDEKLIVNGICSQCQRALTVFYQEK